VYQLMDLFDVMDISVERTWKVSSPEVKLRGIPPETLAWHCPFRASRFHITHDFYNFDLMAILKFLHTPMSGPPQKFFQSNPTRDLSGPVSTKSFSFGQVHIKHEQPQALLPDSHATISIIQ